MQTLADLMNSAEGLRFLESNGVFVQPQDFKAQLEDPIKSDLANRLGFAGQKLVCSGQQIYIDYRQSVLSKIVTMHALEQDGDLSSFFLWLDTDRSGSDNLSTKFAWPTSSKKGPIRIAPSKTKDTELRFVQLDATQLRSAIDKLGTHLRQSGVENKDAKLKYEQLRAMFVADNIGSLSEFNHQITNFLLNNRLGFSPHSAIVSEMISSQTVKDEVDLLINHIAAVISVLNESINSLIKMDINPQVKPRHEDYLPFFYSCDIDNHRLRLHHMIDGVDHFAVGACASGHTYKFYLGNSVLSIDEIAHTNRWSPDVFLPALFNDSVSGFVAGKSSALYLIVINAVLSQVLGKQPVPVLVPDSLSQADSMPGQVDSLLYDYFSATQ